MNPFLALHTDIMDAILSVFGDGLELTESKALWFAGHSTEIGGIVFRKMVAEGLLTGVGKHIAGHPVYSL